MKNENLVQIKNIYRETFQNDILILGIFSFLQNYNQLKYKQEMSYQKKEKKIKHGKV